MSSSSVLHFRSVIAEQILRGDSENRRQPRNSARMAMPFAEQARHRRRCHTHLPGEVALAHCQLHQSEPNSVADIHRHLLSSNLDNTMFPFSSSIIPSIEP